MGEVPDEITLPMATMIALGQHAELAAEMEAVAEEQGTAGLIEWLDAHGLPWYAGATDPLRAFADALAFGEVEWAGDGEPPWAERSSPGPNRKARRKAARSARRLNRRRR